MWAHRGWGLDGVGGPTLQPAEAAERETTCDVSTSETQACTFHCSVMRHCPSDCPDYDFHTCVIGQTLHCWEASSDRHFTPGKRHRTDTSLLGRVIGQTLHSRETSSDTYYIPEKRHRTDNSLLGSHRTDNSLLGSHRTDTSL